MYAYLSFTHVKAIILFDYWSYEMKTILPIKMKKMKLQTKTLIYSGKLKL
jgi:hypothetical protein